VDNLNFGSLRGGTVFSTWWRTYLYVVELKMIFLESRHAELGAGFGQKTGAGLLIDSQEAGWPFCLERQRKTTRRFWLIVNVFARNTAK